MHKLKPVLYSTGFFRRESLLRGALFDLDGTLVNTLSDLAYAMNRSLRIHGLVPYETDAYRYMVGNGIDILTHRAVGEHKELFDKVKHTYASYYSEHWHDRSEPYPGIMELLNYLKKQNMKLCVFSNKPHLDTCHVIRHYFGDDLFDEIQGQTARIPIKPDPAGAIELAERLGVSPEEMLYFGDSGVDMQCAKNAGMKAVGVLWGFRERQELMDNGADLLIEKPQDMITLLSGKE